ncbi:MAG: Txe/YoeB family addiction module toxin [Rubrivivax sp.]|nr:MAG: Txe/YoeB family addiction module toxin [Rubrivivax sp.]
MTTLTASEARTNLYRLIDETAESHQPITISGKRNDAVLVSAEDWNAIQETQDLLAVLQADPFQNPPPFEKLVGDLPDPYSRRINIQHRLVYQVLIDENTVKVLPMWTHYE